MQPATGRGQNPARLAHALGRLNLGPNLGRQPVGLAPLLSARGNLPWVVVLVGKVGQRNTALVGLAAPLAFDAGGQHRNRGVNAADGFLPAAHLKPTVQRRLAEWDTDSQQLGANLVERCTTWRFQKSHRLERRRFVGLRLLVLDRSAAVLNSSPVIQLTIWSGRRMSDTTS